MSQPTDEPLKAVSLKYDGNQAPHVAAKGEGDMAEFILEMAKEDRINIQQDTAK